MSKGSGGGGRPGRSGGGSPEQIVASASGAEKESLKEYVRDADDINQVLFAGAKPEFDTTPGAIKNLDNLLSRSTVSEKTELHRGVREEDFKSMASSLKPGEKFTYKGFMSTSHDEKLARSFSDYQGGKALMAKVTLGPGAKAIKIPANAAKYMDKREAGKETLVGRGQKFTYKGMTETSNAKVLNFEYSG
jgi:hypothetical protein